MNKKRVIIINTTIVVIILLVIFFIRPGYLGFVTYENKDVQELKDEILISNINLSTCYDFNQILIDQLEQSSDKLDVCNKQISNYAVSEEKYKVKIDKLEEQIDEEGDIASKYKNEYDELAVNLANKICCKMKIDNNKINYYKIEDNNLICSEESGEEISCSFG